MSLTFNVSDVLLKVAEAEKINVEVEGIDDTCGGLVVSADKSFVDFLNQHKDVYNFLIVDGDPIRIIRRAIGDSLVIDFDIRESDCIPASQGAPAVLFQRVDPESLPGEVQLSYIDPDRDFNVSTQSAKHRHVKKFSLSLGDFTVQAKFGDPIASHTRLLHTVSIDFIITADQARQLAFDYLYRIWANATSVTFEHANLSIEPGDTIRLTADAGIFTLLVEESTITKRRTNLLKCSALLTSSGVNVSGFVPDSFSTELGGPYFGTTYFGTGYFGKYA
jgi:hypothetical protein